jgi:hypothetical protein
MKGWAATCTLPVVLDNPGLPRGGRPSPCRNGFGRSRCQFYLCSCAIGILGASQASATA